MSPVDAAVLPGSWDEVEETQGGGGDFKALDPGTYAFYLADFEKRDSQAGNEYVHLTIIHEKDEDDIEEGEQRKYYIFPNLNFTPKTLGQTKRALRVMGCDLSLLVGVVPKAGVVPDEVLDMLEEIKGESTFECKVKRTRYKNKDGEMQVGNEVLRWVSADGD